MNPIEWPFADPPNTAVFTDKRILDGSSWIYYVGHDADDGAWQFHGPDGFADEANAKVIGLKTIFELDASISALVDLPLGWCAWRDSPTSAWQRAPQQA
jgi:hypothetical protein